MRMLVRGTLWAALVLGLPGAGAAFSIDPNTRFTLGNHPDGAAAPPDYGLRIDGLNGDRDDIFTFSFEGNGAAMTMDYLVDDLGARLHIFGQAWGGLDAGERYRDPQLWAIDFIYTDVEQGKRDVLLFAEEGSGSGTLTPLQFPIGDFAAGEPIELEDEDGEHSFSFALKLDFGDFDGITGRGWLEVDDLEDGHGHHDDDDDDDDGDDDGDDDDGDDDRDKDGAHGSGGHGLRGHSDKHKYGKRGYDKHSFDDFDFKHGGFGDHKGHKDKDLEVGEWLFTAENPRPVPEPGSFALLCLGLAGVARGARRLREGR